MTKRISSRVKCAQEKEVDILFINDEPAIGRLFRTSTENVFKLRYPDLKFNVDVALNGIEGLGKVRSKKYDMIFLDYNMPVMGGGETLANLRKMNVTSPIVGLSSLGPRIWDDVRDSYKVYPDYASDLSVDFEKVLNMFLNLKEF